MVQQTALSVKSPAPAKGNRAGSDLVFCFGDTDILPQKGGFVYPLSAHLTSIRLYDRFRHVLQKPSAHVKPYSIKTIPTIRRGYAVALSKARIWTEKRPTDRGAVASPAPRPLPLVRCWSARSWLVGVPPPFGRPSARAASPAPGSSRPTLKRYAAAIGLRRRCSGGPSVRPRPAGRGRPTGPGSFGPGRAAARAPRGRGLVSGSSWLARPPRRVVAAGPPLAAPRLCHLAPCSRGPSRHTRAAPQGMRGPVCPAPPGGIAGAAGPSYARSGRRQRQPSLRSGRPLRAIPTTKNRICYFFPFFRFLSRSFILRSKSTSAIA